MEQHYVFIKNNIVEQIAVFNVKDEELADIIAREQGYDDAIWVGENKPAMFSSYDGEKFIDPTEDYLYERGILIENTEIRLTRIAAEEATKDTPTE